MAIPTTFQFLAVASSYVISPDTFKFPLRVKLVPVAFVANSDAAPPPTAVLAIPTHFDPL